MKVGDLYRFRKPLMHYLSEYEGRFFIIREVKQNGDGDFDDNNDHLSYTNNNINEQLKREEEEERLRQEAER